MQNTIHAKHHSCQTPFMPNSIHAKHHSSQTPFKPNTIRAKHPNAPVFRGILRFGNEQVLPGHSLLPLEPGALAPEQPASPLNSNR
jgi:hypothetical protein